MKHGSFKRVKFYQKKDTFVIADPFVDSQGTEEDEK